jgi:hypothetical protein
MGFNSPLINVEVKDSLDESAMIDTAFVEIHIQDDSNSIIEGTLISEDDNISNTQLYSYSAYFDVNSNMFDFGIVVSAPSYHSFVTKDISFQTNSSCGADNTVNYTVYLCPLGTSCL